MDPVTFEVVKHRLWQINDEQGVAIKTVSASPIVVEGNDYNVGLFTSRAELVTAGVGSLVHVTTMGDTVASIIARAGEIRDGDAFLTNDPYLGALHQNDIVLASPVFRGGRPFMWAANVLHHADVGGIDAGSFCINARTIFEDPPRLFMKILDGGALVRESEHTLLSNSRLPDQVAIDLRAQIAAVNVAGGRIRQLLDELGDDLVDAVMRRAIDISERQVRDLVDLLPEGSWEGAAFMDGVRVGDERICRVAATLTRDRDGLHFDYTGSSEQVDAAVNCTYSATVAGSAVPLYSFLCQGDIDWNDGLKRCIRVTAPEGTVVNALHPAPVSISTVGFRWLVTVAAGQAVARMFAGTERFRDRACPSWNVSSNCNNIFAVLPDGRRTGAMLSDHRGSGAAGRTFADGFHHAGTVTSYASSIGNVESTEWKIPIRYLYRRRLPDSGGAGEHRGGATCEAAIVPHGVDELELKSTNTAGTEQSNAHGMEGGYPGAGSQAAMVRDAAQGGTLGADGDIPPLSGLPGTVVHLPSKADATIRRDDVFVFWAAGGGGFGDPLDRPPSRVARDVGEGLLSREWAEALHGVVLDGDGGPDEAGTSSAREAIREARRSPARRVRPPAGHVCRRCGADTRLVAAAHPLRRAGPLAALRHRGDGPNFVLVETACATCGTLLDVTEALRETLEDAARGV